MACSIKNTVNYSQGVLSKVLQISYSCAIIIFYKIVFNYEIVLFHKSVCIIFPQKKGDSLCANLNGGTTN